MKFSLRFVFAALTMTGLLCLLWGQSQQIQDLKREVTISAKKNIVIIRQFNDHEGVLLVGEGCTAKVAIVSKSNEEIQSVEVGPGSHLIHIYRGGLVKDFGFFLDGKMATIQPSMGASGQSFGGAYPIDSKETLAYVVDNNERDGFSVVLSISKL